MKKFFLFLFILVNLAVIGASAMFLAVRLGFMKAPVAIPQMFMPRRSQTTTTTSPAPTSADTPPASGALGTTPLDGVSTAPPVPAGSRKILFKYRNSIPKKVMIRADFTGWRAEAMQKNAATKEWEYTAILEPGEYSYLFSVDDKPVRDPANKRTKKVGTTVVSSLVVTPLNN